MVPSKTGGLRPVINLNLLNRYLRTQHFKMETLNNFIKLKQEKRLGNLNKFDRCNSDISRSQEVPSVLHKGQNLQIL